MAIEQALVARLTTYSGLATLIGYRVFSDISPQKPELPYVVYQRIGRTPWRAIASNMGVQEALFQIDVWANTPLSRLTVSELILEALERQVWTLNDIAVLDGMIERDTAEYEPDTELYRQSMDFRIWHRE